MSSIAFGMQLARGQVGNPPDPAALEAARQAAAAAGIPVSDGSSAAIVPAVPPPPPPPPGPPQMIVPPMHMQQMPAQYQGGMPAQATPQKFVPSEVEVVTSSSMKHGEPRAILHTDQGDIVIKLLIGRAPRTVKNFMELARGDREFSDAKTSKKVRRPFYNGLTFHKVVAGEYVQTGCPFGNGRGGPGYTLQDEVVPELTFDRPGLVAMAPAREGVKTNKDTNGSQFFITLAPQPTWNGNYTIFGEVIKGLSVINKIANVAVGPTDRPIRRVYINSIDVIDEDGTVLAPTQNLTQPTDPATPDGAPVAPPVNSGPAPASVTPPQPVN